jgi:hypothetical protein
VLPSDVTDIAGAVRAELATELARIDAATSTRATAAQQTTDAGKLDELHRIHGLKSGEPMTVTPTSRVAGDISQTISGDGTTTTTVTRA